LLVIRNEIGAPCWADSSEECFLETQEQEDVQTLREFEVGSAKSLSLIAESAESSSSKDEQQYLAHLD
jgi:hypothetical protein